LVGGEYRNDKLKGEKILQEPKQNHYCFIKLEKH